MAIPDYQSIMLPLLTFMSDRKEHKFSEMVEQLSAALKARKSEGRVYTLDRE